MNSLAPVSTGEIMESVIIKGDLARLTPEERSTYYMKVCQSVGLNPMTRPFEYITLNGKLTLYARRDAADQLRKINRISLEIVDRSVVDGLLTVHVRARDPSGRTDEDFGVLNIQGLKGEAAANAMLKAVTKAKRRVTLSISGLGFLSEDEIEDAETPMKSVEPTVIRPQQVALPAVAPETGGVGPRMLPVDMTADEQPDWIGWGSQFVAAIGQEDSLANIDQWQAANAAQLKNLAATAPKIHKRVTDRLAEARKRLTPPPADDGEMVSPADLDDPARLLAAG